MGLMMNGTGTSQRLIDFSNSLVGHMRGGLAYVNVVVSMLFAGISGSSSADTAGVGSVMIPGMIRERYSPQFSVSLTAASSTLGNIIPPSIMMIIYASSAGISVGGLFLTGIIPGILLGAGQLYYSHLVAKREQIEVSERFIRAELRKKTRSAALALAIPVIVIGGIMAGVFTATEASVIAVLYTGVLAAAYKQASFKKLYGLVNESMVMFSIVLFCAAAASVWAWVLAFHDVPQRMVGFFVETGLLGSPYYVFVFVVLLFLIIGTFMDAVPAIIILQPIIGELVVEAGIDPYHMGIVVILTLAIGLITPPYGLCLLIASDIGQVSVMKMLRPLLPFFVISIGVVLLAILFPDLMLWIPRMALPDSF
jgi:tripartite ATP-independent transporter DctM subunit